MYAIIEILGKQYRVAKGDFLDVDLLGLEQGATVEFNKVLFLFDGNGHILDLPALTGFTIIGEVVGETAGPKIQSIKYKPRKRQNRKFGHRQHYSRIKINEITQSKER